MKIISWNVNGIRAVMKKGLAAFLKKERPDILCLQEIKINEAARAKEQFDFKDYFEYWNPAEKAGYSGTAALIKRGSTSKLEVEPLMVPLMVINGLGKKEFDREGRVQTVEFDKFYLLNVYFPHSNHELTRLDFKLKFNQAFLNYAKKLEAKKPLIIGGDFNVAHEEIDLARPKDNSGNPGFTDEERKWMTKFLNVGYTDSYRYLNGQKVQYSWWSYRFGVRSRNVGWRIDYFCLSEKLKKFVKKAFILDKIIGSDHCPVGIEFDLPGD